MHRKGLSALVTMDNIFLVVLVMVAIVFLVQSYQLNPLAGNLPKIISWIMLGLIAFLLYGKAREVVKASKEAAPAKELQSRAASSEGAASSRGVARRTLPWFVTFVLILLYPVFLVVIGFPAGTFIMLTGLSWLLGLKPLHALLFGVLGSVALVFLFVNMFQVPLPDGMILESIRGY
jgi:hypothetical protein